MKILLGFYVLLLFLKCEGWNVNLYICDVIKRFLRICYCYTFVVIISVLFLVIIWRYMVVVLCIILMVFYLVDCDK